MMGGMSGIMDDMGGMMEEGKMTPEETGQMSKIWGHVQHDKQMSERMNRGTRKTN